MSLQTNDTSIGINGELLYPKGLLKYVNMWAHFFLIFSVVETRDLRGHDRNYLIQHLLQRLSILNELLLKTCDLFAVFGQNIIAVFLRVWLHIMLLYSQYLKCKQGEVGLIMIILSMGHPTNSSSLESVIY